MNANMGRIYICKPANVNMRFVIRANKSCIHIRIHIIHIFLGELLFRSNASTSTSNSSIRELKSSFRCMPLEVCMLL